MPPIPSMPPATPESSSWTPDAAGLARRYHCAQGMVVDYAIGLAIVGMFPAFLTPVLVIAVVLLMKLLWDIARNWQFSLTANPIAIGGWVMNGLGACAVAILAWTTLVFLGAWVPMIDHYALSAALMSGGWTLGAGANQFFMNGFLRRFRRQDAGLNHG